MSNIDNIINKIGKNPVVRDFGLYESYEPETTHKNTVYLATDRRKIYLNGKEYGSGTLDESVIEEFNSQLNNKVDKVEGKLLSTEDFTTILKLKLDELKNYDDTTLSDRIEGLKGRLDTLVNKNASEVIDTFNEIEEFLLGVTNTLTLVGLLQEMKNEIVLSCADTYLPATSYTANDVLDKVKTVDGQDSGLDADLLDGKQPADLNVGSANILELEYLSNVDLNTIKPPKFKAYYADLSHGCTNIPTGAISFYLEAHTLGNGKLYQMLITETGTIYKRFGYGTYGDWIKIADVNSTVAKAEKLTTKQLIDEDLNDIKDNNFSVYYSDGGNTCTNKPSGINTFNLQILRTANNYRVQILTDINGNIYKRYWNETSWSDWKQLATTDGAVAQLTNKQLTDEDLNTLKDVNFTSYSGTGQTTSANQPHGNVGSAFVLQVVGITSKYIKQTITYPEGAIYSRFCNNGTWTPWNRILTKDDILLDSRDGQILSRNSSGFKWIDVNSAFSGMESLLAYGVEWDTNVSDPHLTRIGNMSLHKTLPIQSQMRGCVAQGEKIMYFLDEDDWSKKEDGSDSRLDGYDGTVRVYIPSFYIKSESEGTKRRVWISTVKIDDTWEHQPESLIDAYQCTVLNTVPDDMGYLSTLPVNSAISVVNTSAYCRGGGNRSANDAYLTSDLYKSDLGKQRTSISRAAMRTYARNAGSEMLNYYQYKNIFYWLYVIEYANFNCQEAFNESLTSEGYHQGGMGSGVTNWSWDDWNTYNGRYPIIPCGYTNNLGNKSGIKEVTINETKMYVPRWRCFENFFGHIWTNLEGIIIDANAEGRNNMNYVYACADHTKYSDSLTSDYKKIGEEIHADGYIKEFDLGNAAHIIPASVGGNTTLNKCDYHYTGEKNAILRTLLIGGRVLNGSLAGVGYFHSGNAVAYSYTTVGFRSASCVSSASA